MFEHTNTELVIFLPFAVLAAVGVLRFLSASIFPRGPLGR